MIRLANSTDIAQIIDLGQQLDSKYEVVNDLNKILGDSFTKIYVAEIANKIIGFIQITELYENIEIIYLVVNVEYQRQKIGTALLNYIFTNGATDSIITLEVRSNNIGAISFYEKMGFKRISVRPRYYGEEDAVIMQRKMNSERD